MKKEVTQGTYPNKFASGQKNNFDFANGLRSQASREGWRYLWRFDTTTCLKLIFGIVVSGVLWWTAPALAPWYLVSTLAMALLQFVNTLIELVCDMLAEGEYDEKVKITKDVGAAMTNIPTVLWYGFSVVTVWQIVTSVF